jgi:hypothetical protein
MSRPDSERALAIYKMFTKQTEEVVQFLGVARHFQSATRLEIPKLKHASTDLARLLEDDLNDPDFDLRRREYLAGKGIKQKAPPSVAAPSASSQPQPTPNPPKPQEQKKPPPPDLIDFFESIEQNQQPMGQQPSMQYQQTGYQQAGFQQQPQQAFYPQQTGLQQRQTGMQPQPTGFVQQPQAIGYGQVNPYGGAFPQQQQNTGNLFGQPPAQQLQAHPTGAGFGGYGPQPQQYGYQSQLAPIPQNGAASFPQQQPSMQNQQPPSTPTNPFRQSMLANNPTGGAAPAATPLQRQNTNPFAKRLSMAQFNTGAPEQVPQVPPLPQSQPQAQPQAQPPALQPQRTGTNPFARASSVPPQNTGLQPLRPNPTGSTNPFRQSQFINQQTGQGWQQSGQNGTIGGLEQLDTVPVFPRPGMT